MAAGLKMAVKKWFFDHNSVNIKYFTFSLLLFVIHNATQISKKKSFLFGTKWRRKLKMVAKFQWAVTFFLMNFFSIGFFEEVFEFFHKMAPLAQGVGQDWFFYHDFKSIQLFSICFLRSICIINTYVLWKKSF
jgi:hypothetical protein